MGRKIIWPILAFAAVLVFNFFFTKGFFDITIRDGHLYGSLIDVINRAAPVMLIALGMTLVIATGGVDLSVGAVTAIAGAVAALLITRAQAPMILLIVLPLAAAAGAGVLNGVLVAKFGIQPIVATLILMVSGRGFAQLLTEAQIIRFSHPGFQMIGGGFFLGLPFSITIVFCALLFTYILTRRTALGLFIESIGGNETAARFCGVSVGVVKFAIYTFSGICSGMAGLILTSDIKSVDPSNIGLYTELDAILAVVVGGTALTGGRFSLVGSLIGALLMQSITTTIYSLGIQPNYALIVKASVILSVCVLQSEVFRRAISLGRSRAA